MMVVESSLWLIVMIFVPQYYANIHPEWTRAYIENAKRKCENMHKVVAKWISDQFRASLKGKEKYGASWHTSWRYKYASIIKTDREAGDYNL